MVDLSGRNVIVAGATSASGQEATRALREAGAEVIALGRDAEKLARLEALGAHTETLDLTDEAAVDALATRLRDSGGRVDGVLHLVGGWRGGGGLAGQSEGDYRFLEHSLTALRHVTRAFDEDLKASTSARVAMISSTAVARPLAGGANYAAVKAASEAWIRAVAQGFAKAARDQDEPLRAAAVVFRIKSLDGFERTVADAYVSLWDAEAADVNDAIIDLRE